jgi:hypothetical protein
MLSWEVTGTFFLLHTIIRSIMGLATRSCVSICLSGTIMSKPDVLPSVSYQDMRLE